MLPPAPYDRALLPGDGDPESLLGVDEVVVVVVAEIDLDPVDLAAEHAACHLLVAYGYKKDITIYEILDPIPAPG